jgi:hypothetical protein
MDRLRQNRVAYAQRLVIQCAYVNGSQILLIDKSEQINVSNIGHGVGLV